MRDRWIILLVTVGVLAISGIAVMLLTLVPPMLLPTPGDMYPPAPPMPVVVAESAEELLGRYEALLADEAPTVLAALQPGLSDEEIDAIEAQHGVTLPPDLRALYRWRNGTAAGSNLNAFPDHRFVPLDAALAERDALRQQVKSSPAAQRAAYAAYAGHRDPWLGLIVDPAGDGYFFDPQRTEAQGSFFFNFNETGDYTFYPAFRNYLAEVLEGYEAGILRFGTYGAETADFLQAATIGQRYGASNVE